MTFKVKLRDNLLLVNKLDTSNSKKVLDSWLSVNSGTGLIVPSVGAFYEVVQVVDKGNFTTTDKPILPLEPGDYILVNSGALSVIDGIACAAAPAFVYAENVLATFDKASVESIIGG